jgi:hypothetical protein
MGGAAAVKCPFGDTGVVILSSVGLLIRTETVRGKTRPGQIPYCTCEPNA